MDEAAIFVDRDGVINELVFNPITQAYESPHLVSDLTIIDGACNALQKLSKQNFKLFIVSNQPSYAKGKTTLENIKSIAESVKTHLSAQSIEIVEDYYCYHHPEGTVPEFTKICDCRKPKPYFLIKAANDYGIDLKKSWMIGDQDSDIECGQKAGCQTALVTNPHSESKRGRSNPTFISKTLAEAAEMIINSEEKKK